MLTKFNNFTFNDIEPFFSQNTSENTSKLDQNSVEI